MDDEWRFSPGGVAAIIVLILGVAAVAYYIGRFGEPKPKPAVELPDAGPPAPRVDEHVPTPADVPPTVTPSLAVVIEKEARSSSGLRAGSSQIEVPVPPAVPTVVLYPPATPTSPAPPRRQIVIEVAPTPTPTVEESEEEPSPREATPTPLPPPHEMEPTAEPTPGRQAGGSPVSIWSLGSAIAFSFAPRSTQTKQDL